MNAKGYMGLWRRDELSGRKRRQSFLSRGKHLCIYREERIEEINKMILIKNLTSPVLKFGFAIRSMENFKDGVI